MTEKIYRYIELYFAKMPTESESKRLYWEFLGIPINYIPERQTVRVHNDTAEVLDLIIKHMEDIWRYLEGLTNPRPAEMDKDIRREEYDLLCDELFIAKKKRQWDKYKIKK